MLAQLIFNSIVSGLLLALVAVGFNLIFNTTKVFHLAHGAVYVCGPYALVRFLNLSGNTTDTSWIVSVILSLMLVLVLAVLIEVLVYRPLSKRNASQTISLISSMGVYLLLVNLIALLFGNETKFLDTDLGKSIDLANIIIVPMQVVQLVTSLIILTLLIFFSRTTWFLRVKAMMSHEIVASVVGVNTKAIRLVALSLGSIMAAVAAILRLYDTGIDPQAGMAITLSAAVAVIIGGGGSLMGTIIASLLIAFLQTATEWYLSAQWKEGVTFLLLIIVILWRTEGIVSFKMRVEEK
jgi:branched-chain amino acid transport system permease protein